MQYLCPAVPMICACVSRSLFRAFKNLQQETSITGQNNRNVELEFRIIIIIHELCVAENMKRKHSHNSAGEGCQIISKFFKTSSDKDVKDAGKHVRKDLHSNSTSKSKLSLAGPVLQKLTKLRETLSRRALNTDPLGSHRNEKKEDMEERAKVSSEDEPQTVLDTCNSNGEMTENDTEELNGYDRVETLCSLQENSVISISSDSSLEKIPKSQGQGPVDVDTEKKGPLEDYQDTLNESDTNFRNTSDMETSFITEDTEKCDEDVHDIPKCESSDDEKVMDFGTEQDACLGHTGTDSTSNKLDKQFSSCINLTDSEATSTSQFSHDSVNSPANGEASDSDDDLLLPPSFLYEKKTKPEVHTPEKLSIPLGASPMSSPVKPVKNVMQELEEQKYRYSVNKLLKEKNRREVRNAALTKMEADLDAGIKKGGIKTMTDIVSEDETDSELDDGKDLSKCKLPKEVSKHLVKVSNFSEDLEGEDIFPEIDEDLLKCEMPILNIPNPSSDEDTFILNLMSSKPDDIKELINGGWIMQYYLKRPCPAPVAEWVFHIMCFYPDIFVSSQCFKTLWALLRAGTEDQGGIPKGVRGMTWVPNIKNIILVLQHYGATSETIIPNELKTVGIFPFVSDPIKSEEKDSSCMSNGSCYRPQLVFLIGQLIQFLTHCLHMAPQNFTVKDLHFILVISCRLSLDLRLQEFLFDIEMLVFEALNCFGESQWEEKIKELPLLLVLLTTNHRHILHILQIVPLSERGSQLRQLTSVILIEFFIKEFSSEHVISDRQRTELLQNISKTATAEVSKLLSLVDEIQPKQTSSYHLLHTIISLFDLSVGNEDHPSSQRAELKKLANKLSNLNSDIKDPRAAYLDRTKVKDLLVRTVNKIHFLVQAIEPPKERELTEYFETNSSDYEVHTLEETLPNRSVPTEGNVSSPETGSISSPGGSVDSCDGSDQEN